MRVIATGGALVAMTFGCATKEIRQRPETAAASTAGSTATSAAVSAAPQDDGHRAGTTFHGAPRRPLEYLGDQSFIADTTRYGIFQVGIDRREELWLARSSTKDSVPDWSVVASFIPPDTLNDDVRILLGCRVGGTVDPTLAVVLRYEDLPVLRQIVHAWRADPARRRFQPVPTAGIECPNPGR